MSERRRPLESAGVEHRHRCRICPFEQVSVEDQCELLQVLVWNVRTYEASYLDNA